MSNRSLPPDYLAIAQQRNIWFGRLILAAISTLVLLAATSMLWAVWFLLPIPIAFFVYAAVRFAILNRRSAISLRQWLQSSGDYDRSIGLRAALGRFVITHPTSVGLGIFALLFGMLLAIAFGRH